MLSRAILKPQAGNQVLLKVCDLEATTLDSLTSICSTQASKSTASAAQGRSKYEGNRTNYNDKVISVIYKNISDVKIVVV